MNHFGEVEGFWKIYFAMKFSGVTTHIPKSFQVHAQDRRQGKQFDSLKEKRDAKVDDNVGLIHF